MPKRTLTALSLIAFSFGASAAVTVTTGAGYVPMVEKLVEVCKNETAAQKNRAKLGGVMAINEGYEPIEMVAAVVEGAEKDADVRKFLGCLASPKGKKVLEKAGVR